MKKRLFFALPLTSGLYVKIAHLEKEIEKKIKVNWIPLQNLHLTLLFLGYIEINKLNEIINESQKLILGQPQIFKELKIKIKKIDYGPPFKKRMIWLYIEKNNQLMEIKHQLEKMLNYLNINYQKDHRDFLPHINLTRLKKNINNNLPNISQELNWGIILNKINLYESYLEKPFARYEILSSFKLFSC
jgi:2'-5' RNA ligase